jgi:hypothetical protein
LRLIGKEGWGAWARDRSSVAFLASWTWLDIVANLRFPDEEARLWYLPCLDTVVLFGALALAARLGRRVPRLVAGALAFAFSCVRLLRFADGISRHFLRRPFHVYTNLSLLPELPRLLHTTMSTWALGFLAVALVAGLAALTLVSYAAVRVAARCLLEPRNRHLFGVVTLCFAALSLLPRRGALAGVRPMSANAAGRLVSEVSAVPRARRARERVGHAVADTRARFGAGPNDLAKLGGADVLLFIVESYGATVLHSAPYATRMRAEYAAFDTELGARGYGIAASVLDSPAFGGGSWFAHAALDTGVRVTDQFEYEALCAAKPLTIAHFFEGAGYRTVLVQPATERALGAHDYLDFDRKYLANDFRYRGPPLGWGKMPDQFVIDATQRRELLARDRPRLIEYALVTSHAPWFAVPSPLDDWSRVGDGSIFASLTTRWYSSDWASIDRASDAYLDTIIYDFEVLRRYLASELHNDTLVIIVGDHQPPGAAAGTTADYGVPIHVLSRKAALVAPFLARGYAAGMTPRLTGPHLGLESFLLAFLRDFSADLRQTSSVQ